MLRDGFDKIPRRAFRSVFVQNHTCIIFGFTRESIFDESNAFARRGDCLAVFESLVNELVSIGFITEFFDARRAASDSVF